MTNETKYKGKLNHFAFFKILDKGKFFYWELKRENGWVGDFDENKGITLGTKRYFFLIYLIMQRLFTGINNGLLVINNETTIIHELFIVRG